MNAADYLYPDFMRPIGDDNRDEYLLVEFRRTFKNTNFSLLRNLMKRSTEDPEILKLFPKLILFAKMPDNNVRYDATVLYNTPEELIYFLSGDQLSPEICHSFVEAFQNPLHLETLHQTRLEFAIGQLALHPFIKEIYFFADNFTTEMQEYLVKSFGAKVFREKIRLVEGPIMDCFFDLPKITTAFISNVIDLISIYEVKPESLYGKLIVISEGYDNFEPLDEEAIKKDPDGIKITYKYLDLFQKLHRERKADVSYAYPFCIESTIPRKDEP